MNANWDTFLTALAETTPESPDVVLGSDGVFYADSHERDGRSRDCWVEVAGPLGVRGTLAKLQGITIEEVHEDDADDYAGDFWELVDEFAAEWTEFQFFEVEWRMPWPACL